VQDIRQMLKLRIGNLEGIDADDDDNNNQSA
jgi:hypothetical protein